MNRIARPFLTNRRWITWTALLGAAIVVALPVRSEDHGAAAGHAKVTKPEVAPTETPASAAKGAAANSAPAGNANDRLWADLMEGNRRFVAGHTEERELIETRKELAAGQHPKVIVLTCADSRLSPELIFDKNLGELFVVRTAGNVSDAVSAGSIEYAADHLNASLLVVMGHEGCGAVAAAASNDWMPTKNLHEVIRHIQPAILQASSTNAADLPLAQVKSNVRVSTAELLKVSPLLAERVEKGELQVVRAVYRLSSGQVEKVEEAGAVSASAKPMEATKASASAEH